MEKVNFNRLVVDKGAITSQSLDVGEFFLTLTYLLGYRIEDLQEQMLDNGTAKFDLGHVVPTQETIEKTKKVLATQSEVEMSKEEMLVLAKKLKEMFPKGLMMDGIPWTEGPMLIVQRLEGFFRRFGSYPADEIETAMQRYVNTMRKSPFMRSLKNAIYKETPQADGTIELQSDLYNFLENAIDPSLPYDIDWTSELRE